MKKLLQLGLIIAGAAAFTLTAANATCGSGKEAPKEMKCQTGKCGANKVSPKGQKCQAGKSGAGTMESKKMEDMKKSGKCGKGKCGSN